MTVSRTGTKAYAAHLAEAQASVAARHAELAYITAALVEKENELEAQAVRVRTLETQLAEARNSLAHAQGIVDYNLAELRSMQSSKSWRLMAPVRGLSRLLRR